MRPQWIGKRSIGVGPGKRWLQVKDFEGDTGWASRSLTGDTPPNVVKRPTPNMRSGPTPSLDAQMSWQ